MEAFRGPHLGVGQGMGPLEGTFGLFEVQSCWVPSRSPDPLLTGCVSDNSRRCFAFARNFIDRHVSAIGTRTGLPTQQADVLKVAKPACQLHCHFATGWVAITPPHQMGAIFISLVSLVVGRPSRADTVVLLQFDADGRAWPGEEVSAAIVDHLSSRGITQLVVSQGTQVSDEASQKLHRIRSDTEVGLQIYYANYLEHLLSICFA